MPGSDGTVFTDGASLLQPSRTTQSRPARWCAQHSNDVGNSRAARAGPPPSRLVHPPAPSVRHLAREQSPSVGLCVGFAEKAAIAPCMYVVGPEVGGDVLGVLDGSLLGEPDQDAVGAAVRVGSVRDGARGTER